MSDSEEEHEDQEESEDNNEYDEEDGDAEEDQEGDEDEDEDEDDEDESEESEGEDDDTNFIEDIRAHVLEYYGLYPEKERKKREKIVSKFKDYVEGSGIHMCFYLIVSELIQNKKIKQKDMFKYVTKRFKDFSIKYAKAEKHYKEKTQTEKVN